MQIQLYNDLRLQTLGASEGASGFAFPTLVQGPDVVMGFRFHENTEAGWVTKPRDVRGVKLSLGKADARPTSGTWKFRRSGTTGASIAYNADGATMLARLRALFTTEQILEAVAVDGSWLVISTVLLEGLTVTDNLLAPSSFVRWWYVLQDDGRYLYEFRLVQTPVAFTDQFISTLPPEPEVRRIQAGDDAGGTPVPEIQELRLDPWFGGVFRLKRDLRRSGLLSAEDTAASIQIAIQSLLTEAEVEAGANLTVSWPANGQAWITFGGALAGIEENLLEVEVISAPVADPWVTLGMDSADLATALRGKTSETFQLELIWRVADATAAPSDEETVREVLGYRGAVTVLPRLNFPELAVRPEIDWMRPPSPSRYAPFSRDNVYFGSRHYVEEIADDAATVIDHGLGTDLVHVQVWSATGVLLTPGAEFVAEIETTDSVTVTLADGADAPARAIVCAVAQEEHFREHGHAMAQVEGLLATLAALETRLALVEDAVPSGTLTVATDAPAGEIARWALPSVNLIIPSRKAAVIPSTGLLGLDTARMRGTVLPAIHTTDAPGTLPDPLPASPTLIQCGTGGRGKVWRNESGGSITVPGVGGPSFLVEDDGLVGAVWDAARGVGYWYPVRALAGTSSYFPIGFEASLFEVLVSEKQFRPRKRLRAEIGFDAAILKSANRARWDLVMEYGIPTAATDPGTPGANLSTIDWATSDPFLRVPIYLGPVPTNHRFGLDLRHVFDGEDSSFTAAYSAYGATAASAAVLPGATFGLRARLERFDTVDGAPFAGLVGVRGLNVGSGDGDSQAGFVWIE